MKKHDKIRDKVNKLFNAEKAKYADGWLMAKEVDRTIMEDCAAEYRRIYKEAGMPEVINSPKDEKIMWDIHEKNKPQCGAYDKCQFCTLQIRATRMQIIIDAVRKQLTKDELDLLAEAKKMLPIL